MSRALRLLKRIPVTCVAPLASVVVMLRGEVAAVKRRVRAFHRPSRTTTRTSRDWKKQMATRPWRRWTRRTGSVGSRSRSHVLGRPDRGFQKRGSFAHHHATRRRLRRRKAQSDGRESEDSSSGWRTSASDGASAAAALHHHTRHRLCARCRRRDAVLDTFEQKIQTLGHQKKARESSEAGGIHRRVEVRVSAEARPRVGSDGVWERGNYTCTLSGDNGLVVPQKSRFFADHVHQDLYGSVVTKEGNA